MKKVLFFYALLLISNLSFAQDMYLEYKISGMVDGLNKVYFSSLGMRTESEMNLPKVGKMMNVTIMSKGKPNSIITFNDKSKTYTVVEVTPKKESTVKYEIKVLGNEKVGPYNCVHTSVVVDKRGNMEMWTTKDIPGYQEITKLAKMNDSYGSESMYQQLKANNADGMVVKYLVKAGKGMKMELVKAEKRNNPASLFEPPAGYTKGASFDPDKIQNMSPEEKKKLMEKMMKQYGGKQ